MLLCILGHMSPLRRQTCLPGFSADSIVLQERSIIQDISVYYAIESVFTGLLSGLQVSCEGCGCQSFLFPLFMGMVVGLAKDPRSLAIGSDTNCKTAAKRAALVPGLFMLELIIRLIHYASWQKVYVIVDSYQWSTCLHRP